MVSYEAGIEPTTEGWEASVLPLNYAPPIVSDSSDLCRRFTVRSSRLILAGRIHRRALVPTRSRGWSLSWSKSPRFSVVLRDGLAPADGRDLIVTESDVFLEIGLQVGIGLGKTGCSGSRKKNKRQNERHHSMHGRPQNPALVISASACLRVQSGKYR